MLYRIFTVFNFSVLSLLACSLHAQETAAETQQQIVRQALRYNDFATATTAIHHIIAVEGPESVWRDSLLLVYFQAGNYLSSQLLASELQQERPQDNQLLEINAASLAQLGAAKEAINAYEQLYARTQKVGHGYELANLQYRIKRLAEAEATLSAVLAQDISEEAQLRFPKPNGGTQVVCLEAVAWNLRGMIAFDLKQEEQAMEHFQKALDVAPDFAAAKQNATALATKQTKDENSSAGGS